VCGHGERALNDRDAQGLIAARDEHLLEGATQRGRYAIIAQARDHCCGGTIRVARPYRATIDEDKTDHAFRQRLADAKRHATAHRVPDHDAGAADLSPDQGGCVVYQILDRAFTGCRGPAVPTQVRNQYLVRRHELSHLVFPV
jgi:hypothetical protein